MTDDPVDTLLVEVRAGTQGFASDIQAMRANLDATLFDGFSRAGSVLERGLISAIGRSSTGFDDLKRVALRTMDEIAARAVQAGLGSIGVGMAGAGNGALGLGSLLSGTLGVILGLPGRAMGGSVSPGRPYLVGERGPELFVPTSAGQVENGLSGNARQPREVRVAIQLAAPRGASAPVALQRSARQVASSVRKALMG
ncbi:tail tape measure protein [Tsuneonella sp. CC-YZS046]|uniref:tail tape measure protein n=1 Tax=Tsuneonella sp. CC-YZS046 TaxID=3042152 RepID=UPI002D799370|nr:tail tape measure protein [Tsuneonella sp. CC-YZS046]WRO65813.1 tail tape measure protein [Tsuneonella sp. CC-YZS046]